MEYKFYLYDSEYKKINKKAHLRGDKYYFNYPYANRTNSSYIFRIKLANSMVSTLKVDWISKEVELHEFHFRSYNEINNLDFKIENCIKIHIPEVWSGRVYVNYFIKDLDFMR